MKGNNKKSVIYIDGENFIHRAIDLLQLSGNDARREILDVDLGKLVRGLVRDEVAEIKYYTTKVRFAGTPPETHDKLKDIVGFNAQWLSRLANRGITVIRAGILRARQTKPCPKCGNTQGYFVEKGVDVRLAVDIVEDSRNDNVGKMYIVSSDLDLLPAIQLAKKYKKKIIYIASAEAVNGAMVATANQTLTFTKQNIKEAKK